MASITSGFIDLATFDEIEKYMYGGPDATAYFVREVRKSTWFTQVPVLLTNGSGTPAFGQKWSVNISRAGDYLLQTWLRVTIPSVQLVGGDTGTIRWTPNLMHNLLQFCSITFNDLEAAKFTNFHLDFWAAFTTPAGKQIGYNNMIGNFATLTNATPAGVAIPSVTLNLPLPLFFERDSGVALPTAALPYMDMKINLTFANWNQLLIYNPAPVLGVAQQAVPATAAQLVGGAPVLGSSNVWANYAIVSNDERKRMACGPRDILIEQVYWSNEQTWAPQSNPNPSYDLRFSYAVKVMFFSVKNNTCPAEWSNYTACSATVTGAGAPSYVLASGAPATDPILQTTLTYESTVRLYQMGSDYFSLVNPWFHAPVIPTLVGYHQYSYSLEYICLDPMGSTNYGKLTNVSIQPQASADAVAAASAVGTTPYASQIYQFLTSIVVNNIIRISGGALGFPVL